MEGEAPPQPDENPLYQAPTRPLDDSFTSQATKEPNFTHPRLRSAPMWSGNPLDAPTPHFLTESLVAEPRLTAPATPTEPPTTEPEPRIVKAEPVLPATEQEPPQDLPAVALESLDALWEKLQEIGPAEFAGWALIGIPAETSSAIQTALQKHDLQALRTLATGKSPSKFPAVVSNILTEFGLLSATIPS